MWGGHSKYTKSTEVASKKLPLIIISDLIDYIFRPQYRLGKKSISR